MAKTNDWVQPFRRQVWKTCIEGWNLMESRGRMRLQVREEGRKSQSLMLPYDWSEEGSGRALPRIQEIFKRYKQNDLSLVKAAQYVETSNSNQRVNWEELFIEFRTFKPSAGDKTWNAKYMPVLKRVRDCFETSQKKPVDGTALTMKVLKKWEQGSRSRTIARQCLTAFLNWSVERGHLKPCYLPPAKVPEVRKPKRIGFPLSDTQILQLLDGLSDERWRFAIQLCSVYGLRPEELRYLRIKEGKEGDELWSIYQKSKGGDKGSKTDQRRLYPLFVKDMDGKPINWKLQNRIKINESLPPLGREGMGGLALGS